MAQNTRWPEDSMRPSDTMRPARGGGATILAVIAVIILAGLVYLAAHGFSPTTVDSSAPAVSTTTPPVVAPNPAAPAAPTAPTPPAVTDAPAPTNP